MKRYSAPVSIGTKLSGTKRGAMGVGHSSKQISDSVTRITGRSYIGEINASSSIPTSVQLGVNYQTLYNGQGLVFDITPTLLGDRCAIMASTYEKYVYHSMKFTYVPQCPTTTPGSVALVFDRDPTACAADTNSKQLLSQVMSYEHAVLTPAYIGASVSFARDPMEKKTWFIGGSQATLSTRETSQGQFLAYISNGSGGTTDFNGAYGFIIFDYVIDLIAPSLMPARSIAAARPYSNTQIGQWLDGTNCGTSQNIPLGGTPIGEVGLTCLTVATVSIDHFATYKVPDAQSVWDGLPGGMEMASQVVNWPGNTLPTGGSVYEMILSGSVYTERGTDSGTPVVGYGLTAVNPDTGNNYRFQLVNSAGERQTFTAGSKLFLTTHTYPLIEAEPPFLPGAPMVSFHLSLASAIAALDGWSYIGQNTDVQNGAPMSDVIAMAAPCKIQPGDKGDLNTAQWAFSGWLRCLVPGTSFKTNAFAN